ncbi:sigma-54 dependent transcriptional regulator [Ralstonia insidiosa]|jgi:DNA-binding NtrC family response regulator|uniref:sigma-54 interaction domain-containing protein n=1 Tax=Ralstonia TaxID=48736 RepID=UPI000664B460|nr:sigma-54 dependent transcriptional regulator [Ralstonia insidiosa]KMW45549.1 Fis family transcriptional regulator [Ralstonia sp. MD27]MBX3772377.1 sigma-54 dependent transcriptional regulator [Ralstonia pickettii]NOZ15901.1 sigma-54-dependent Fis family transcriptional regulator [Betaproteobacteria bacterium]MBA9857033.1 sigma-54-dependent Fis family transcriptional regulator [Ralstonia insidiosa]MBA9870134.1 sigma-54-dependent Fis family transcriptional regulator [Ralstonia insidiosa]
MSLSEANAFDRAVTAGRLRCPPGLAELAEFDDTDHVSTETDTPASQATQTIAAPDFGHLYGRSPVMRALYSQIAKVSNTLATVLIMGESGTGKELIANTVHDMSARADQAFIAVNCGAISPNLIESELFGHEKGSFTGAAQRHIGYFEHASGGTIFLDEITEMPVEMQVKLLRVLETGVFMRVGGTEPIQTRVRIIAATNRNLMEAVADGAFREDLMYRLAVVPLHVPPLRERDDDIEELALHFLAQFNAAHQTDKVFSRAALGVLRNHAWPGNVRELRNAVQRGYILGEKTIELTAPLASPRGPAQPSVKEGVLSLSVGVTLADAQRTLILATLEHFRGDKRQAAKTLGVSLKTLYNRLELYQNTAAASMAA